jgi:hypothetical protein
MVIRGVLVSCVVYLAKDMQDPLEDINWQKHQDDKLWARKVMQVHMHNVKKIKCPCNLCLGSLKPRLVDNVQKHLIKFG